MVRRQETVSEMELYLRKTKKNKKTKVTFHEVRCILFVFHYFSLTLNHPILSIYPKFWKDVRRTEHPVSDLNGGSLAHLLLYPCIKLTFRTSPTHTEINLCKCNRQSEQERHLQRVFPRFPHSITAICEFKEKYHYSVSRELYGNSETWEGDMSRICLKARSYGTYIPSFLHYLIQSHFILKMRCSNSIYE